MLNSIGGWPNNMSEQTPTFLTLDEVLEFHAEQVELFGGDPGVRDFGLLESAIAQPRQAFGGSFLHEDLALMAAAYLFHIVQNHPFADGNKRTGTHAAHVFLRYNGMLGHAACRSDGSHGPRRRHGQPE